MSPTLGREEAPGARTVDAQNPWPGLAAFTEEQQAYFFGRDEEAGEVLRRVKRKTLTVLFGMSGLGKTSLLQAGVFPRLRRDGNPPPARALPRRDQRPRREPSPARARRATGHAIRTDRSPRLRQAGLSDPVQPPRGLPASARRSARAHALHHGESAAADPDDRSPSDGGGDRAGARPRASRRGTADRALRR